MLATRRCCWCLLVLLFEPNGGLQLRTELSPSNIVGCLSDNKHTGWHVCDNKLTDHRAASRWPTDTLINVCLLLLLLLLLRGFCVYFLFFFFLFAAWWVGFLWRCVNCSVTTSCEVTIKGWALGGAGMLLTTPRGHIDALCYFPIKKDSYN